MRVSGKEHWESVYAQKKPTEVSWFESSPRVSLELVDSLELDLSAPVIDIGGGASHLAGELLARGFQDVTVADISTAALGHARRDLGARADEVKWEQADVRSHDFGRQFALWHDRAVFHFMVDPEDRDGYLQTARSSIAAGGHALVAAFGPDGPASCSGLPVRRYSAEALAQEFGAGFALVTSRLVEHETPAGAAQQFTYVHLQRD